MVDIYIHAGAYKTATTSIQKTAYQNKGVLLEKYDCLYPSTGLRPCMGFIESDSQAHHLLAHCTVKKNRQLNQAPWENYQSRLKQEILETKPSSVLISTELLTNTSLEIKKEFIKLFVGLGKIHVIYCTRRPDAYVDSLNNQALKTQKTFKAGGRVPFLKDLAEWSGILDTPPICIHFRATDSIDFINCFFGKISSQISFTENEHSNASPTIESLKIRKIVLDIVDIDRCNRKTKRALINRLAAAENLTSGKKAVTITPAEREKINQEEIQKKKQYGKYLDEKTLKDFFSELKNFDAQTCPPKNISQQVNFNEQHLNVLCEILQHKCVKKCLRNQSKSSL